MFQCRQSGEIFMARILVIDDEIGVRMTIQAILKRKGHNIVLEESGRNALAMFELFAFDAIIVDIFMPDMDGLDTIKALTVHAPKVPIIAISGYLYREGGHATPDLLQVALALGASACLHKPFKAWELIRAVETCCGFAPSAAKVA